MSEVTQCAGRGPYRPEALKSHAELKYRFVRVAPGNEKPVDAMQ